MIHFFSENRFLLSNSTVISDWINRVVGIHGYKIAQINYIFCDDEYLLKINQEFLNHDTYTDVITFDDSEGKHIAGEIYISTERVTENARHFKASFRNELHRVMIHGILHLLGWSDSTDQERKNMRQKEKEALALLKHNK